jgi:predicted enzyme related to lactoylglutathione lyase
MATGSVTAIDQEMWELVTTNTPRTGTETTFSSLSGYKKFLIAFNGLACPSGGGIGLRFNGSGSNYYGGAMIHGQTTYQSTFSYIHLYYNASGLTGTVEVNNVNNNGPKIVKGIMNSQGNGSEINYVEGGWLTTDAITSITILANGTWNAGSVSLYGIVA